MAFIQGRIAFGKRMEILLLRTIVMVLLKQAITRDAAFMKASRPSLPFESGSKVLFEFIFD